MVFDVNTKKVVAIFKNKKQAIRLRNMLNSGCGFNGPIPEYMFNGWMDRPTI